MVVEEALKQIETLLAQELTRFDAVYRAQLQSGYSSIQSVLDHLTIERGKRIRPILFFLCQGLVGRPSAETAHVAVMIEMLHMASLIHDDVVDGSMQRRGRDTVNARWDNRISILLGDWLMSRVLRLIPCGPEGTLNIFSDVVDQMAVCELEQALSNPETESPDEETYQRIIFGKTAALFSAVCRLAGLAASSKEKTHSRLSRFGELFGMAFQIRDDVLDIIGDRHLLGKPVGQDSFNSRMNLPLILSWIRCSEEEKDWLRQCLEKASEKNRERISSFVHDKKGHLMAQKQAGRYSDEASVILSGFARSKYREAIENLLDWNLSRKQ
ncbi:MAG TPA: polyprenyl synthetase family protein [bacterium]|nr:polyprenyl synthetase family protein [bacterium]